MRRTVTEFIEYNLLSRKISPSKPKYKPCKRWSGKRINKVKIFKILTANTWRKLKNWKPNWKKNLPFPPNTKTKWSSWVSWLKDKLSFWAPRMPNSTNSFSKTNNYKGRSMINQFLKYKKKELHNISKIWMHIFWNLLAGFPSTTKTGKS